MEKGLKRIMNEIAEFYDISPMDYLIVSQYVQMAYAVGFEEGRSQTHHKKRVVQMTMEGKILKEWPSILEAAKALRADPGTISMVVVGKRKHAYGYIWKSA